MSTPSPRDPYEMPGQPYPEYVPPSGEVPTDPHYRPGQVPTDPPYPQYAPPAGAQGPGYATTYGQPPAQGTDGFSIAALVTGVLFLGVVPLVLGIIGVSRTRRTGRRGKGMAIAGIVLGSMTLVVGIALAIGLIVLVVDEGFEDGVAQGLAEVEETLDLTAGQCFAAGADLSAVTAAEAVPCETEHGSEIVGTADMTDGFYPGADAADTAAYDFCLPAFGEYVGIDFDLSELDMTYFYPSAETWEVGDRQIVCVVQELGGAAFSGTVAGAAR